MFGHYFLSNIKTSDITLTELLCKPKVAPSDNQCESVTVNHCSLEVSFFVSNTKSASIMIPLSPHNRSIVCSGMVFGARRGGKKEKKMRPPLSCLFFHLPITIGAIS